MLLIMDFTNQRSGCLDGSVYSFLWLWQNAWGKQLTGRKGSSGSWMLRFQSVVDSMAVGVRREVRTLWGWGHVRRHKASQCKTGLMGRGRGEAGHVSRSICQSVSLSIRYTLQWLHPLCVSKAREACLSPWNWSYSFELPEVGPKLWSIGKELALSMNHSMLSSTQIVLIRYVGMSKVEM